MTSATDVFKIVYSEEYRLLVFGFAGKAIEDGICLLRNSTGRDWSVDSLADEGVSVHYFEESTKKYVDKFLDALHGDDAAHIYAICVSFWNAFWEKGQDYNSKWAALGAAITLESSFPKVDQTVFEAVLSARYRREKSWRIEDDDSITLLEPEES